MLSLQVPEFAVELLCSSLCHAASCLEAPNLQDKTQTKGSGPVNSCAPGWKEDASQSNSSPLSSEDASHTPELRRMRASGAGLVDKRVQGVSFETRRQKPQIRKTSAPKQCIPDARSMDSMDLNRLYLTGSQRPVIVVVVVARAGVGLGGGGVAGVGVGVGGVA